MSEASKRHLMDKHELIEYLNGKLSFDTAGRLTREGKIPFVKFPGIRRFFYDREAIDHWLDSLQNSENKIDYGKLRKVQ